MSIKVVAIDYDGTLIESFKGDLTPMFSRILRPFYLLGELIEVGANPRRKVHTGAKEFLYEAFGRGLVVGIVTDRSLFSLVLSARRAGIPLEVFRFIHARRSLFDCFVRHLMPGMVVMTTPYLKGDSRALVGLLRFCGSISAEPDEVFFLGDKECDRIASEQCGFRFAHVDRMRPDFGAVRSALKDDFKAV